MNTDPLSPCAHAAGGRPLFGVWFDAVGPWGRLLIEVPPGAFWLALPHWRGLERRGVFCMN